MAQLFKFPDKTPKTRRTYTDTQKQWVEFFFSRGYSIQYARECIEDLGLI